MCIYVTSPICGAASIRRPVFGTLALLLCRLSLLRQSLPFWALLALSRLLQALALPPQVCGLYRHYCCCLIPRCRLARAAAAFIVHHSTSRCDIAACVGNLRTSDRDGPYNITLLSTQYNEVKAGIAARQNYTDLDIIHFLTNVECLEGQFDTWGTFGYGFLDNLTLGGPTPIGARKANLTERTLPYLEEVALNEQVSRFSCWQPFQHYASHHAPISAHVRMCHHLKLLDQEMSL